MRLNKFEIYNLENWAGPNACFFVALYSKLDEGGIPVREALMAKLWGCAHCTSMDGLIVLLLGDDREHDRRLAWNPISRFDLKTRLRRRKIIVDSSDSWEKPLTKYHGMSSRALNM
jgi:hypothetical protein